MDQPQNTNLWSASLPLAPHMPALTGERSAEVAVVGGGYVGCSAALSLAERSIKVCLLESEQIGWGASGRSAGQVNPGLKLEPSQIEAAYGADRGARIVSAVGSVADDVFSLIKRHGIQCDAVRTGWVQPAPSARGMRVAENRAWEWSRRGADVQLLDRGEVAELLGSDSRHYRGGLIDRRGGNLNPLAYVRGLATAACQAGAEVYCGSPVTHLKALGGKWKLSTPQGHVMANKVLICTNGYTGRTLWPRLSKSFISVMSFQVATAPLSPSTARTILPGRQSVSDLQRLMWYYRMSADGRLVIGGRAPFGDTLRQSDLYPLKRAIGTLFPQLKDQSVEFYWSGRVAITMNHLPHLNELAPGVWSGLGFGGRGIGTGTLFGLMLARLAAEDNQSDLPFPVIGLALIRGHGLHKLGARAMIQYYRLRDWFDRHAAQ